MSVSVTITNSTGGYLSGSAHNGVYLPRIAPGDSYVSDFTQEEYTLISDALLALRKISGVTVSVSNDLDGVGGEGPNVTVYVSGDGDDTNPGTSDAPVRTWAKAQELALAVAGPSGLKTVIGRQLLDDSIFYFGTTRYNGSDSDPQFAAPIGPSGRLFFNTPNWHVKGETRFLNDLLDVEGNASDDTTSDDPDYQPQYYDVIGGPAPRPATGVGIVITNLADEDTFDSWFLSSPPTITIDNADGTYSLTMTDPSTYAKAEDFGGPNGSTSWLVDMNITLENLSVRADDDNDVPDRPCFGLLCLIAADAEDTATPADQRIDADNLHIKNCDFTAVGDGENRAALVVNTSGTILEGINTGDKWFVMHNAGDMQLLPGHLRAGDDAVIAMYNSSAASPSYGWVLEGTGNDANRLFDPDQGRTMMETIQMYIGGPNTNQDMRLREVVTSAYGTLGLHGDVNMSGDYRSGVYQDLYRLSMVDCRVFNFTSTGRLAVDQFQVSTLNKPGTGDMDVMHITCSGSVEIGGGTANVIQSGIIEGNVTVNDDGDPGGTIAVELNNVNINGNLTLEDADVTVTMKNCTVLGSITVGTAATLNIEASNLNRTVNVPSGGGTINT